jgi:very-short-patch-repair endonuclease
VPTNASFDRDALARLVRRQRGVISREQALACGMSAHLVQYRIREGGPWQALLTGVYLTVTGAANHDQRDIAALLHAGPRSVVTASAALRRHGLTPVRDDVVDVLVPIGTRPRDAGFVRVHRTARMPGLYCVDGLIRYALVPRAVADAVRGLPALAEVRAVVAEAVQRGMCPIPRLDEELAAGPVRGSALLRQAVDEVTAGIRSPAEARLRDLIAWARLPMPMFNPRLLVGQAFLAAPDCWWPHAGVAVEVDSRTWHLSPGGWERTLARHARMGAHGINVLHFTPRQINRERKTVAATIRGALATGRSLPHIRALPAR